MQTGRKEEDLTLYFNHLLGGISPLVTLDGELLIRFANDSFLQEFGGEGRRLRNLPIGEVLGMDDGDYEAFVRNVEASREKRIQNCEFDSRGRIYGYSVFRFEEETGVILKDITERRLLERKVERLHSELLSLQEREQEKLARELHDSVGQTILAAKLNFTSYQQDPSKPQQRFETGLTLIDRASQELREIYVKLFPSALRDLGLEAAIRGLVRDFLSVKKVQAELDIDIDESLPAGFRTTIFRIIQELFSNIMKHSGASSVRLRLFENPRDELELIVSDNGCGFDTEERLSRSPGYGLQNIQRRAADISGQIEIKSAPGQGTHFHLRFPIPAVEDSKMEDGEIVGENQKL